MDYEQQLQRELKAAQLRVEQGLAASNFLKTPEGKLIQDWINERVSYEMEKMTGAKALDDREYLEVHGAIRLLKDFNVMLQSKATGLKSAQEEVANINGQQTAIGTGQ